MIFAGILAGGKGERMKISKIPKQFLMLGDKPILIYTLEKFLLCPEFDYIYIGVHKDWLDYCNELLEKYIEDSSRIKIVAGGEDRNDTIMNIVKNIEDEFGEDDNNIIVTHDSVRPFITPEIIKENIYAAIEYGATDTVVPATDTIVKSINGETLAEIPNRSELYQGQTPQSFNIKLLKNLFNELTEEEKSILTDACKILTLKGNTVHLIEGDTINMKITNVSDYKIANAILKHKDEKLKFDII